MRSRIRTPSTLSTVPLAGSYLAALGMVLLALSPFIVLSSASAVFDKQLVADLGTTKFGTQLASALANAGYAFGAVAAADLIQRRPKRQLFVLNEAVFVVGSIVCAAAPGIVLFTVGRALEGVSTGLLLVVALPPLITGHGVAKLPLTAAFVNLGLFGMTTIGPVLGGVVAGGLPWRLLFAVLALLGLAGVVLGLFAFEHDDDAGQDARFDYSGIPVAAMATLLPFIAAAWLSRGSYNPWVFRGLLAGGLIALLVLLVRQYRKEDALMPLKLLTHTLPVTGIAVAMAVGAAFTALVQLCVVYLLLVHHASPMLAGDLLATQIPGVLIAAWLFKRALRSRWLPVLSFAGLGATAVAGGLVAALGSLSTVSVIVMAGFLLGFGAGAGVAPGLFLAGLSVPSNRLGPTFALVELLRSEAAFLIAPIVLALAMTSSDLADGVHVAAVVLTVGVCLVGVAALALLLVGGVGPHAPDLDVWLEGDHSAFKSPPLAASVRDV